MAAARKRKDTDTKDDGTHVHGPIDTKSVELDHKYPKKIPRPNDLLIKAAYHLRHANGFGRSRASASTAHKALEHLADMSLREAPLASPSTLSSSSESKSFLSPPAMQVRPAIEKPRVSPQIQQKINAFYLVTNCHLCNAKLMADDWKYTLMTSTSLTKVVHYICSYCFTSNVFATRCYQKIGADVKLVITRRNLNWQLPNSLYPEVLDYNNILLTSEQNVGYKAFIGGQLVRAGDITDKLVNLLQNPDLGLCLDCGDTCDVNQHDCLSLPDFHCDICGQNLRADQWSSSKHKEEDMEKKMLPLLNEFFTIFKPDQRSIELIQRVSEDYPLALKILSKIRKEKEIETVAQTQRVETSLETARPFL